MSPRRSIKEKLELQRKFLQELAKYPEGITLRALLKNVLGETQKSGGWSSFFRFWRGENKPLSVKLTELQTQKLSLKVEGFAEYADSSRSTGRRPIYFHPDFKKLYDALKPYENAKTISTPTKAGLDAEMSINEMVESSRENVDRALQAIRGIELSFLCPHCGKPVKFRHVNEEIDP